MDVDLICADCGLPLGGSGVRRQIVLAGRRNEWENAHGNLQICIDRLRAEVARKDAELKNMRRMLCALAITEKRLLVFSENTLLRADDYTLIIDHNTRDGAFEIRAALDGEGGE